MLKLLKATDAKIALGIVSPGHAGPTLPAMLRTFLRSKIHRATVTRCDPDYVGSITVDAELLRAAQIRPNEAVDVLDIDNAARISTYAIQGGPGSGAIEINGAAAKLFEPGHKVIIIAYGMLEDDPALLDDHVATVVLAGEGNTVADVLRYPSRTGEPAAV